MLDTGFKWLDFNEWKRLKVWRHYKELMLCNFGPFVTITNQDELRFNEFYKEEYPENYDILNLESWKK
jgi:hypothetical protein